MIFVFLTASCSDKDSNSEKKKLEDAKFKYLTENIFKNGGDEFIALLSIKYNLNIDLTRKIIDEFIQEDSLHNFLSLSDAKTVEEFEKEKTKMKKPSVEERIKKSVPRTMSNSR
jgi:hypothetical protein